MRRYGLDELRTPDAYSVEGELATLARRLSREHYETLGRGRVCMGGLREEFLAGLHADVVWAALEAVWERADAVAKRAQRGRETVGAITPPAGYRLELTQTEVLLHGPFEADLHRRLVRAGAQWDGAQGDNRKCWIIPTTKVPTLARIFNNWEAGRQGVAEQEEAHARSEIERWLGYVEDKAPGYLYETGVRRLEALGISRWPALAARLTEAKAQCAARQKAKDAATLAARGARAQTARSHDRPQRRLYALDEAPRLALPVRLGSAVVVFTGHGRAFRISEDDPSIWGSHLLGHEGSLGAYFYYREASAEERAALLSDNGDAHG